MVHSLAGIGLQTAMDGYTLGQEVMIGGRRRFRSGGEVDKGPEGEDPRGRQVRPVS